MAAGDPDGGRALRPVRWPRRPGGGTLLRAGLVAALLGLAVIVLDHPTGCAGPTPGAAQDRPAGARGPSAGGGPAGPDVSSGQAAGARGSVPAGAGRPGALALPGGAVGVPVRLAEPAALAVLRPGARVDLLVVPGGQATTDAILLAPGALVLDVVSGDATDGTSALYLALQPDQARRTIGQPEGSRFAVVVRG
ncbi:flagellar biosynthesis protein FlgA [Micromonospora sp. CPCC 205711]|uniref:flagellar biosynthesis protein FlgA n=1 Tax=Micromonospora sp. CPCC 205547 TaxID=3122400 RepID=UPI002FEF4716